MKKAITAAILSLASPWGAMGQNDIPGDEFFKVEVLSEGFIDAMEIAVAPTGDVFIVERTGALKWYQPKSGETVLVKQFDVSVRREKKFSRETGLLGITLDPNFLKNGWLYCYYSPTKPSEHRLSRFNFKNGKLRNEKILLKIPQDRDEGVCHEGGSLAFDSEGNLFIGTGDNTNPFASDKYAPLDERRGKESINSQRSASNTNDLRGKVLRIKPQPNGTYTIPEGNLFPAGKKTRPEIFVMGCRNPWRIGVDSHTDTLYWGDVGPDARKDSKRGPRGYCEINQAATAGNYGWPYFVADNKPYARYDFKTEETGEKFKPSKPINESRLNTGLKELPVARNPFWFKPRSCYCAAGVYHYSDYSSSAGKLPESIDGCLVTYDWNNGKMQLSKIGSTGNLEWKKDWLGSKKFVHPSDVEFGVDGSMYVLEYGTAWYDGVDGKLKKVTYNQSGQEVVTETADPRLKGISPEHPGYTLLSDAVCLSCHQTQTTSIGPSYNDVALRYRGDEKAANALAQKILEGGVGAWGEISMPAHPQYNKEQVSQMVDAIMTLAPEEHKE